MYIPAHFSFTEYAETVAFMQRYPFATVVNMAEGRPVATHLPFVVTQDTEGKVCLSAHFAKNNPQWACLEAQTTLVIFAEPHAYVSPSLYEKKMNVPTWNYVAVHAYGQARLVKKEETVLELLEKQIKSYEKAYFEQWADLPMEYKAAMVNGIVAFEIPVEKLEAKRKLSQNKTAQERQNIMGHLLQSPDSAAKAIGEMMVTLQ